MMPGVVFGTVGGHLLGSKLRITGPGTSRRAWTRVQMYPIQASSQTPVCNVSLPGKVLEQSALISFEVLRVGSEICICMYIYIYIYIEREREITKDRLKT